jgi:hypothetical protein
MSFIIAVGKKNGISAADVQELVSGAKSAGTDLPQTIPSGSTKSSTLST